MRRNSPWDIPFLSGNLEVLLLPPQALVSGLGDEPDPASAVFQLPLLSAFVKLARNRHTLLPGFERGLVDPVKAGRVCRSSPDRPPVPHDHSRGQP